MSVRAFLGNVHVDKEFGGRGRITGTVDELGIPGRYRVRLYDRKLGRLLRALWSAPDGSYSFDYLKISEDGYLLVALDHGESPLNAAIADRVIPELIP